MIHWHLRNNQLWCLCGLLLALAHTQDLENIGHGEVYVKIEVNTPGMAQCQLYVTSRNYIEVLIRHSHGIPTKPPAVQR